MSDEIPQIADFRRIMADVDEFVKLSDSLSSILSVLGTMVQRSFQLELDFIINGVYEVLPSPAMFSQLIEPLSNSIATITDYRNNSRSEVDYFNHLSTVSESIAALGWISVRSTPAQFVRDMREAGDYYGNRVLSSFRGNADHCTWVSMWKNILLSLENYVREHHLTGFQWGIGNRVAGRPARGQHPPPPPPPPPPSVVDVINVSGDGSYVPTSHANTPTQNVDMAGGGESYTQRGALLKDLNQGVNIVRRLKPVVKGGPGGDAPVLSPSAYATACKLPKAKPVAEQPAKFVLDGRKWRVEYQKNVYDLVIKSDDMSQSISCYKCENMGLEVRSKINGVTIDTTQRSTIVLSDVISSVELIRCSNVKVQCNGVVPLISMDNCDSVSIFLTERSIGAEMISSKSTSSNVCLLKPDGDYTEIPVPEQIKTTVVGKKLQSTVVETN